MTACIWGMEFDVFTLINNSHQILLILPPLSSFSLLFPNTIPSTLYRVFVSIVSKSSLYGLSTFGDTKCLNESYYLAGLSTSTTPVSHHPCVQQPISDQYFEKSNWDNIKIGQNHVCY